MLYCYFVRVHIFFVGLTDYCICQIVEKPLFSWEMKINYALMVIVLIAALISCRVTADSEVLKVV